MEGLSFLVGPEGGFDPEEVQEARDAGVVPVSLGQRTLRGETAGLAIAAAVMYQVGELGK
jgi:16S rRNA (uracil1498-N3)-methyltransferase